MNINWRAEVERKFREAGRSTPGGVEGRALHNLANTRELYPLFSAAATTPTEDVWIYVIAPRLKRRIQERG